MNRINNNQIAVFLLPLTDHNGAFSSPHLSHLIQAMQKTHTVVSTTMTHANIGAALKAVKFCLKGKITAVFICGHGSPSGVVFNKPDGTYHLENICAKDFKDIETNGSIYLLSCNSAPIGKKIASFTDQIVYAPRGTVYTTYTILVSNQYGHNELFYCDPKSHFISTKYRRTPPKNPDGSRVVLEMPMCTKPALNGLVKEALENNTQALFISGIYFLHQGKNPDGKKRGLYYLYLAAQQNCKHARDVLQTNAFLPEASDYLKRLDSVPK